MYPTSEQPGGNEGFGAAGTASTFSDPRTQLHTGLNRFMASVFGWMAAGLVVTAAVAFFASTSEMYLRLVFDIESFVGPDGVQQHVMTGRSVMGYILLFSPLAMVLLIGGRIRTMDRPVAIATFLAFSALMGASLGYIPLVYSVGSLGGVFVITSGMFAVLAAIGFFTKRDLSILGRFLLMGVIGLILAGVVSMFVPGISFWLSVLVVLVFAGLTAYDTQKIKQTYLVHGERGNVGIIGALELYIDFINIFLAMLRLFGGRE